MERRLRPLTERLFGQPLAALALGACWALAGCAPEAPPADTGARAVAITTAQAQARAVEVLEESIGYIETETAPMVAAEVAGRLTAVEVEVGDAVTAGQVLARLDAQDYRNELRAAQTETARLAALVDNQRRVVERFRSLGRDRFVSETALDEAEAQLKALTEQRANAAARADIAARALHKTTVTAPVPGTVQQRLVSAGTYVTAGQALVQIATREALRVHLPFPETAIGRLAPGQKVYLESPTAPGQVITATLGELRPMVGTGNRAGEAIVQVHNPGAWSPGASVTGRVVLTTRTSVLVPDVAVVLRPAGRVVYTVNPDHTVSQNVVTLGTRLGNEVEILSGINPGQTVAKDGAHYLSHQASVRVQGEPS